jgi:high-affinity Fe2+/Pb2+ permease
MEKLGYLLITGFFVLITLITLKEIENFYPEGIVLLLVYGGLFVLFVKVLRERLSNKEDDYYSKEIRK